MRQFTAYEKLPQAPVFSFYSRALSTGIVIEDCCLLSQPFRTWSPEESLSKGFRMHLYTYM